MFVLIVESLWYGRPHQCNLIAPYTPSPCNGECVSKCLCVFERGKGNMFKRKVRVRVCVHDQPNKLHGCSLTQPLLQERRAACNLRDKRKCRKQLWGQIKAGEGSAKWLLELLHPPHPLPSPTNLPPLPPSLLLLLLLSPVRWPCFFFFFSLSISKGQRGKKGRNQRQQSSNSTYKHAGIIMGRPRRCHDNTQGGEGGGYGDTEAEMGERRRR